MTKKRKCTGCQRKLPETDYYFRKHPRSKNGLTYKCKECTFNKRMFAEEGYAICGKCEDELPQTTKYFYVDNYRNSKFFSNCKKCEGNSYAINDKYGLFNVRWRDLDFISGIYKITCTGNNKYYIGSASDFCVRWSTHLYDLRNNKHHSSYMQNSFNKYGEQSFKFDIIESVKDLGDLLEREQFWLDKTKAYDREYGFNVLRYAGSSRGVKHSEEVVAKMSETRGTEVSNYDLDGNFIDSYRSMNYAQKETGVSKMTISKCVKGINLYTHSGIWLDKNEDIEERLNKIKKVKKTVIQYDLDGNFIKEWFLPLSKIAKELGGCNDISNAIRGECLSSGGYMWRYRNPSESIPLKIESRDTLFKLRRDKGNIKRGYKREKGD